MAGCQDDVAHRDTQLGVSRSHFEFLQRHHVAQFTLERPLQSELEGGGELGTVGGEYHLTKPRAEARSVHPLAGIGEDEKFQHVGDVVFVRGDRGPAPVVEAPREVNVHGGLTFR